MLLILVILVVLMLGTGPWYPYSRGWGYGPSGVLTILLVILIIFMLLGRSPVIR